MGAESRISGSHKGDSLSGTSATDLPGIDTLPSRLRRLIDVIDFLPDATFVIDNSGKVIAWNQTIEKMTGIPKREILGKGDYIYAVPFYGKRRPMLIDIALNPEAANKYRYDSFIRDGDVFSIETFVPTVNAGQGAYFSCSSSPLHDSAKNLIGAIQSVRDITNHRKLEEKLYQKEKDFKRKASQLGEINTALRVLIKNSDEDRKKLQNDIQVNIRKFILPYLNKVKKGRLDHDQKAYLELIESSLQNIVSPFITNMNSAFNYLTPMEINIATLIREGKTGKEIASLLGIAYKTVETHRYKLRMKLGIQNEKINLRSFLISIA